MNEIIDLLAKKNPEIHIHARRRKDVKAIAHAIRSAREEAGLSKKQLADECRFHITTITDLEMGIHDINLITLYKVADTLKLKVTFHVSKNL